MQLTVTLETNADVQRITQAIELLRGVTAVAEALTPAQLAQIDHYKTLVYEIVAPGMRNEPITYAVDGPEVIAQVDEIMLWLSERENAYLRCRFGLDIDTKPKTYEAVGLEFGVTEPAACRTCNAALRKLRDPIRTRELMPLFKGTLPHILQMQRLMEMYEFQNP